MPRRSVFPYVGGKSYEATWIVSQLPDHRTYVEAFGGAASVLVSKPRSGFEVYNDKNGDVYNFFEVLRDRPDDLVEFLTPLDYSRDRFDAWNDRWYRDEDPIDDPVERAGIFFYLQMGSTLGVPRKVEGLKTTGVGSPARTFVNARERLRDWADRFEGVVVENRDYRDLVETYDDERTLFYLDPPYHDPKENYYLDEKFDHGELATVLGELEGMAVVSYDTLPAPLDDLVDERGWVVETREVQSSGSRTRPGETSSETERLLLTFDPRETPRFVDEDQRTLGAVLEDG